MDDYLSDTPLTVRGQQDAKALGSRLKELHNATSIYVSPLYRCLETARMIAEGAGLHDLELKVEPGLMEWTVTSGGKAPTVLSHQELVVAGFKISREYKPSMKASDINDRETTRDYSRRSEVTFKHCLRDHELTTGEGTMLVVAHQLTVLTLSISLVDSRIPFVLELLQHGAKLPYLGHVRLSRDGHLWDQEFLVFASKGDREKYTEVYRKVQQMSRRMGYKYWDTVAYFALNAVFTRFPSLLFYLAKGKTCWTRLSFQEGSCS
ncbi:ecdysteroid-phosphate phosphatase-like [Macrobrachium nipponense]|uniref:ecdysteroid-phosphate phosphatase-like n=1 Tax=Macrobrachium nipponense TaxID=159736 RepID=UPI0030C8CA7F